MITLIPPRPDPSTFELYDVVWEMWLAADKAPELVLRGSAAWLAGQERGVSL